MFGRKTDTDPQGWIIADALGQRIGNDGFSSFAAAQKQINRDCRELSRITGRRINPRGLFFAVRG